MTTRRPTRQDPACAGPQNRPAIFPSCERGPSASINEAAPLKRMAQAEFLEKTCDLAFFVWDK